LSNQITVLVLGTGVNGLGILRALYKCPEMDIGAVNFNKKDAGRFTRLARILNWQDPLVNPDEFKNRLYDLAQNQKRIILFPTNDIVIEILAELSNTLPGNLLYYRNSSDTVRALLDKSLAVGTAARAGLCTPKTCIATEKLNPRSANIHFPAIVKPHDVKLSKTLFKNFFITNENELEKVFNDYNNLISQLVIQEFIPGDDDQIYHCNLLINRDSQTIGVVEFQKLRQYLPQRGTTSYGQTLLSRTMVSCCQQLAEEAGYKGLMNVEFKRDSRTKQWIFIEVNLRLPVYSSIFPSTGVNLAYLYIDSLLKNFNYSVIANHTSIWMREENDFSNILTRKVKVPLKIWFRQIRKVNSFAYWYKKDPVPGFYIFGKILLFCLKRLLQITGQVSLVRREHNSLGLSILTLMEMCSYASSLIL
jgi:predicted ATP-grasp superfamily ATP-dependent carboligase